MFERKNKNVGDSIFLKCLKSKKWGQTGLVVKDVFLTFKT